jgi:hypothetical protein
MSIGKNKTIWTIFLLPLFLLVVFCGCDSKDKPRPTYSIGRDPHCFQAMETDTAVFYKDMTKDSSGMWMPKGLYMRVKESGEDILVSDDFFSCPNYYEDSIFYIDKDYNVSCVRLDSLSHETVIRTQESIENLLIINDWMYYAFSDGDESLFVYDLKTTQTVKLLDQVIWDHIINDGPKLVTICYDIGEYRTFEGDKEISNDLDAGDHIIYFLDNGERILLEDETGKLFLQTEDGEEKSMICKASNLVSVLSNGADVVWTELDEGGFCRINFYDSESRRNAYIGSPDYMPHLLLEDGTVLCFRDDLSMEAQLFNLKTKEKTFFAMH